MSKTRFYTLLGQQNQIFENLATDAQGVPIALVDFQLMSEENLSRWMKHLSNSLLPNRNYEKPFQFLNPSGKKPILIIPYEEEKKAAPTSTEIESKKPRKRGRPRGKKNKAVRQQEVQQEVQQVVQSPVVSEYITRSRGAAPTIISKEFVTSDEEDADSKGSLTEDEMDLSDEPKSPSPSRRRPKPVVASPRSSQSRRLPGHQKKRQSAEEPTAYQKHPDCKSLYFQIPAQAESVLPNVWKKDGWDPEKVSENAILQIAN